MAFWTNPINFLVAISSVLTREFIVILPIPFSDKVWVYRLETILFFIYLFSENTWTSITTGSSIDNFLPIGVFFGGTDPPRIFIAAISVLVWLFHSIFFIIPFCSYMGMCRSEVVLTFDHLFICTHRTTFAFYCAVLNDGWIRMFLWANPVDSLVASVRVFIWSGSIIVVIIPLFSNIFVRCQQIIPAWYYFISTTTRATSPLICTIDDACWIRIFTIRTNPVDFFAAILTILSRPFFVPFPVPFFY